MQSTSSQSGRLDGSSISVVSSADNNEYLSASQGLTLWTFKRQSDGTYTVSYDDNGTIKYLNISGTDLSVSTTSQKLNLTVGTGGYAGQIKLASGNYSIDWYGNSASNGNIFGAYNGNNANNYQVLAEPIEGGVITYNLNAPSVSSYGVAWINGTPSTDVVVMANETMTTLNSKPTGFTEGIGPAGNIYKNNNSVNDEDNPYKDLYRMSIRDHYHFTDSSYPDNYLGDDHQYYKEWRFDGWLYTDEQGIEHLFEPSAEVTHNEDGTFTVSDKTGISVVISSGTTFEGKWSQVSSPVYYFVNYAGTILDTEGDVSGRYTAEFTDVISVGIVLFGKQTVGNSSLFANDAHEKISAMIVPEEDVDFTNEETQIVISHATDYIDSPIYNYENPNINSNLLTNSLLEWIREDRSMTIQLSTGDGNVRIDNSYALPEYYGVRWYVLKDQTDGWHIDGVMTAFTDEMVITKTFNGLSDSQVEEILKTFKLDLKVQYIDTSGNTQEGTYMSLNADTYTGSTLAGTFTDDNGNSHYGISGQFIYGGYNTETNTATWTIQAASGINLTLEESGYEVPESQYPNNVEGYDVSSSTMLNDDYNTLYAGNKAGYEVYEETGEEKYIVAGSKTDSVSFSNTYTEKGKGVLSILKTIADIDTVMQNAEFTLTKVRDADGNLISAETVQTVVTDSSGLAYFNNLEPGTYELRETNIDKAYNNYEEVITVVVTERTDSQGNTYAEVSASGDINGNYGTADKILSINVVNTLAPGTMVVVKHFEYISPAQVRTQLRDKYQITVSDKDGNNVNTIDSKNPVTLTFDNATRISADGRYVYWNLVNLDAGQYIVEESNFTHTSYTSVAVSGRYEDDVGILETDIVMSSDELNATLNITKGDSAGGVYINNRYGNMFDLEIKKIDEQTNEPLSGAIFKIYGSHIESTDTSDTIKYYDENGKTHTLYYIGTTEATNSKGITTIKNLNLSNDTETYYYVAKEIIAPEGYEIPIYEDENGIIKNEFVFTVTLSQTDNGKYQLIKENKIRGETLTIKKIVPVSGIFEDNQLFTIEIVITDPTPYIGTNSINRSYDYQVFDSGGNPIEGIKGTIIGESGNTDSASLSVQVKKDWYIEIYNVPEDHVYKVKEDTDPDKDGLEEYSPVMSIVGSGSFDVETKTATGKIISSQNQQGSSTNIVTVENHKVEYHNVTTTVSVSKQWYPVMNKEESVVMCLYQEKISLDGTKSIKLYENGTITLNDSNEWKYKWTNLPVYDVDGNSYNYYVKEKPIEKWEIEYDHGVTTIVVDGEKIEAALTTGGEVVVTNIRVPTLPDSGGIGIQWNIASGMAIIMMALAILYRLINKRKELE